LAVFTRAVFGRLRHAAARHGFRNGHGGAVTVIQGFGGALNLNAHIHSLVLDGVFTRSPATHAPRFHALEPLTHDDIARVREQVHRRVLRLLRRQGRLPEEPSSTDPVASRCRCREIGPSKGRITLRPSQALSPARLQLVALPPFRNKSACR